MDNFACEVKTILGERGYVKHCYPLEEFLKSIEANSKYALNKVLIYKWMGFVLLILIGVLGVILPLLAGGKEIRFLPKEIVVPVVSIILAVVTIFNSMFKPGERFNRACRINIGIENFKIEFLLALTKKTVLDDAYMHDLVNEKMKEFLKYQESLIELFMPAEIPPDAGKTKMPKKKSKPVSGKARKGK